MKRTVIALAGLLVLCLVAGAALSEGAAWTVNGRSPVMNKLTNTIAYRPDGTQGYRLVDAAGTILVSEDAGYIDMSPKSGSTFYSVEVPSEDGVHDEGLIDSEGRVIVPAKYADVDVISDRWQVGVLLTPCEADDKDYTFTNFSTGEKHFFRVEAADFYFDGALAGTLPRADYGSCTAYGAYICVTNIARERVFYDSHMNKSPRKAEYGGEFDSEYRSGGTVYFHQGTGEQAFVAGCTLNPDDLDNPYQYDKGVVYDIQGREAFRTVQNYDTVRAFKDGYAKVRMNGLYGLIDSAGNEVIPLLYDDLGYLDEHPFVYGYTSAVKDGKFGFLDAQGHETCPFVYSADAVKNRTTFGQIQNLDGTIIVLSAVAGELPEHYQDVSFPTYSGSRAFVATNANKEYAIIDWYGNALLPYTDLYRSIELSADGTLALLRGEAGYEVFRFDIETPAAEETAALEPSEDGSWTCENGHAGNNGNFCTECGAPRPQVPEALTHCANCGYEFGDTVPNFCPNCGQPTK